MDVLIIGVNHQIQPATIKGMSVDGSIEAFERRQKEAFAAMLHEQILQRAVHFVGEECRFDEVSIAQRVCEGTARHGNIDMPTEERERRNIPPGYHENPALCEAEKARCDSERETYMCNQIESAAAGSVIVICGRHHSNAIASLLRDRGHTVEITDVQHQSWYVEDWLEYCMRMG